MAWFINYYKCPQCEETWCDEWSAMCDDDCPKCGTRHISPYKSDDAEPDSLDILKDIAETFRRINSTTENLSIEEKLAMLREHEDGVFAAVDGAVDE